jgi:hypothetical protein
MASHGTSGLIGVDMSYSRSFFIPVFALEYIGLMYLGILLGVILMALAFSVNIWRSYGNY